jgi:signal recognition particle subunit SRP54
LEADVALPVVTAFIDKVNERALGQEVQASLSPGQALIKVVQAELESVMGERNEELDLKANPPAVILMAGLQGAGKTTTPTDFFWVSCNQRPNLATVVVLPAPCKPAIRITAGGLAFKSSSSFRSPITLSSSA